MADMTDILEDKVINHFFRNTSQGVSSAYLALYSVAPTDSTQGTELSATNGYTRSTAITFSAPSGGSTSNTDTKTFTASGGAWSAIAAHALCASATPGTNDAHMYEVVAGPTLGDGDSYEFGAGDITLSFD